MDNTYKTDAVIIGGGLAGIVTAIELLNRGKQVIVLDRAERELFGGQALEALGGMTFVNTNLQRRAGIKDNQELALEDWIRFGEFTDQDRWPKAWAKAYVEHCTADIYHWLRDQGLRFLPVITWGERGLFETGNSVPRYHLLWGGSHHMTTRLIKKLLDHKNKDRLTLLFKHNVEGFSSTQGRISGCHGLEESTGNTFAIEAESTLVATGGIGSNLGLIRQLWPTAWGEFPEEILLGAHKFSDGRVHDMVEAEGGNITHLSRMWNYATGIHHPKPRKPQHGLALLPPRSAVWVDYQGQRIGPEPLMGAFDTRYTCERVSQQPYGYSWSILNKAMVRKEVMISGSEHNHALRDRKLLTFLKQNLLGNDWVYNYLTNECIDVVTADTAAKLAEKMNRVTGRDHVDADLLGKAISDYDAEIDKGPEHFTDPQLKRIKLIREWKGDRPKVCNFQKITDPKAGPLVAIRQFILCRKSLGGIQTDLDCRVLRPDGTVMEGLYAVGEASGFGGGGSNGARSLEGTFLAGCILTGRFAGRAIGRAG